MRRHLHRLCAARLGRWLGPWTAPTTRPRPVRRRLVPIEPHRGLIGWYYRPARRPPRGRLLIAPGLHFKGPADPRFDRFCRALAAAGIAVMAPFLPDYRALMIRPAAARDLALALDALEAQPESTLGRPGLFSISFGSLLALRLAGDPRHADRIGGLVLFGGYADWAETAHFCLTGEVGGRRLGTHDPLNRPVVFLNLLEHIPDRPDDPTRLIATWRRYVEATWGRPELKHGDQHLEVARRLAEDLAGDERTLFLQGCGAAPGGLERAREALAWPGWPGMADPRPACAGIRCPVEIVHGADDDVIPYTEQAELAAAMPPGLPVRTHLTGFYGHTETAGLLGQLPVLVGELATMVRMLDGIVGAAGV